MMRALRPVLMLAVLLSACGGDDGTGPSPVSLSVVNGAWELQLTKTATCSATDAEGSLYVTLAFNAAGDVANSISDWSNDVADPDRFTLIGNFRPATGAIELRLWQQVLDTGLQIVGTVSGAGVWAVEGIDPIPGYAPYLSTGGCRYDVAAVRR